MTTKTVKTMFSLQLSHRILCTVCFFLINNLLNFVVFLISPPGGSRRDAFWHEGTRSGMKSTNRGEGGVGGWVGGEYKRISQDWGFRERWSWGGWDGWGWV